MNWCSMMYRIKQSLQSSTGQQGEGQPSFWFWSLSTVKCPLVAEFYAIVAPLPTQMRRLTLAHLDWTFSPAPFQTPLLLDPDETRNALQMELSNYATWNAVNACINWGFELRYISMRAYKNDMMTCLVSPVETAFSIPLNWIFQTFSGSTTVKHSPSKPLKLLEEFLSNSAMSIKFS